MRILHPLDVQKIKGDLDDIKRKLATLYKDEVFERDLDNLDIKYPDVAETT